LKFTLKEKTPYIVIQMEILKTIIGHALKQLFPENVAFTIASFLREDLEENRAMEQYKLLCATLYGKTLKGKKDKFDRYCKNLRYDAFLCIGTTQK
jgi:hypothetical protein